MQTAELEFMQGFLLEMIKVMPPELQGPLGEILEFRIALQVESDRATALMAAAFLEDYLSKLISCFMVKNSTVNREIFSHNGPLGTFSAKIDMAYMLALISPAVRKDLHLLRKIRNEFAHTAKPLEFTEHRIKSRCEELKCTGLAPKEDNPRTKFNRAMMTIAQDISLKMTKTENLLEKEETIQAGAGIETVKFVIEFMKRNGLDPSALQNGIDFKSE